MKHHQAVEKRWCPNANAHGLAASSDICVCAPPLCLLGLARFMQHHLNLVGGSGEHPLRRVTVILSKTRHPIISVVGVRGAADVPLCG